jgi:hypothetical protein
MASSFRKQTGYYPSKLKTFSSGFHRSISAEGGIGLRKFNSFLFCSLGILSLTAGCAQPAPTLKISNDAPIPIDDPAKLPQKLSPNQVIQIPYENIKDLQGSSKGYQTMRGGHGGRAFGARGFGGGFGRFGRWGGAGWGGRYWGAGWGGNWWGGAYYNNLAFYPYGGYYYPYYFNAGAYYPYWSTPYYYGAGAYYPYACGAAPYNYVAPNYAYPPYAAANYFIR